jgi:hypothetical protein
MEFLVLGVFVPRIRSIPAARDNKVRALQLIFQLQSSAGYRRDFQPVIRLQDGKRTLRLKRIFSRHELAS